jgi:hypothetical protein
MEWPMLFTNGMLVKDLFFTYNENKIEQKIRVHTVDKRSNGNINPNAYFKNCCVWQSSTDDCTFLLRFMHHGETVYASVKQPELVKLNDRLEIRMNMCVIHDTDYSDNVHLRNWLCSAYPVSTNDRSVVKDDGKNKARFEHLKGKTYRVLGVDLGVRSPIALAVGEFTMNDTVNKLNILHTENYTPKRVDEYWVLKCDIGAYSMINRMVKDIHSGVEVEPKRINDKRVVDMIGRAMKFYANPIPGAKNQHVFDHFAKNGANWAEEAKVLTSITSSSSVSLTSYER